MVTKPGKTTSLISHVIQRSQKGAVTLFNVCPRQYLYSCGSFRSIYIEVLGLRIAYFDSTMTSGGSRPCNIAHSRFFSDIISRRAPHTPDSLVKSLVLLRKRAPETCGNSEGEPSAKGNWNTNVLRSSWQENAIKNGDKLHSRKFDLSTQSPSSNIASPDIDLSLSHHLPLTDGDEEHNRDVGLHDCSANIVPGAAEQHNDKGKQREELPADAESAMLDDPYSPAELNHDDTHNKLCRKQQRFVAYKRKRKTKSAIGTLTTTPGDASSSSQAGASSQGGPSQVHTSPRPVPVQAGPSSQSTARPGIQPSQAVGGSKSHASQRSPLHLVATNDTHDDSDGTRASTAPGAIFGRSPKAPGPDSGPDLCKKEPRGAANPKVSGARTTQRSEPRIPKL
ncbi:hypothetical protein K503DRAFT_786513 [Rhizopogon vinicolor AM-OR11-026]|uniref:Uncharacterized protein n=1 Tax=Rhizopogon vinicolor AM-OR11-026 TaxID=1314800 RepID=A0A1B7MLE8_9AGAM|nr:hypothetical protein K503DRAFT_786513 [Rhizopogon vinicolor AM-OR11-026]